jgi:hypothetical protein
MSANIVTEIGCPAERAVLHTLRYFEIFSYPLTAEEVFHYSGERCVSLEEAGEKLKDLVNQGLVFQFGHYFQTKNDAAWVPVRVACNRRADQFLPIAHQRARLIGNFPFVRAVCVSGSLSKHSIRADGDIDFFVITAPGRLWLARTLLVLFKKVFLFNSHKYFCVNYFIDTDHLEIEEKNLFTATESVTLLPMYGPGVYETFCRANAWAWERYPNFPKRSTQGMPDKAPGRLKRMLESLLNGRLGAWLDEKSMRLTLGYWKRKFKHFDDDAFDIALKSRRYVSKHHPLHFQKKVLEAYEALLQERER